MTNENKEVYYTSRIDVYPDNIKHVPRILEEYIELVRTGLSVNNKQISKLKIKLEFEVDDIEKDEIEIDKLDSDFWVRHALGISQ